jgi:hypothetical protein
MRLVNAVKNPRLMHRVVAAGYAALGIGLFFAGQRDAAAAFVVIGLAWFAISFTRFANKPSITK